MAKGQKSSATAGTRKKNARKGQVPQELLPKEKKPKGKGKGSIKEPRKKIYIPPVKPAPIQPDPLDTTGLAHSLPPELVIVLRALGKKDSVTKAKALEDLQTKWVDPIKKEGDDSPLVYTLVSMLPVWFHRVPMLFLHQSRRIRLLAAAFHSSLLRVAAVRESILFFIRETASVDEIETLLGSWCMVAHDIDRQVAVYAQRSWNDVISFAETERNITVDGNLLTSVSSFVKNAALNPKGVHSYLNPVAPAAPPAPSKKPGRSATPSTEGQNQTNKSRTENEEENDQDRSARIRVGALGALRWLLDAFCKVNVVSLDKHLDFFLNPALWTCLSPIEQCPFADMESFGFDQPPVRQAAWNILPSLLQRWKNSLDPLLPILSTAVLRSAWVEMDLAVRGTMSSPLLTFLKEFPQAWIIDASSDTVRQSVIDEEATDDDEDIAKNAEASAQTRSPAYREFLEFLELGCAGNPLDGYPTVLIILSTIPSSIIAASSSAPLLDFFNSFWAAIDNRALNSTDRKTASAAFLSSLLECLLFLIRRIRSGSKDHEVLFLNSKADEIAESADQVAQMLVKEQFSRLYEELSTQKLRADGAITGKLIAQALLSLDRTSNELFTAAWETFTFAIRSSTEQSHSSLSSMLSVFAEHFEEGTATSAALQALIADVVRASLTRCEEAVKSPAELLELTNSTSSLLMMTQQFGTALFTHEEFSLRMDNLLISNPLIFLRTCPEIILTYLSYRCSPDRCLELWHELLSSVALDVESVISNLKPLLEASQHGGIPDYLKPDADELDAIIERMFIEVMNGSASPAHSSVVRQLISAPYSFISKNGFDILAETLINHLFSRVDVALRDSQDASAEYRPLFDVIKTLMDNLNKLVISADIQASLLPNVFLVGYLFPISYPEQSIEITMAATTTWIHWADHAQDDLLTVVSSLIKDKLRKMVIECDVHPTPEHILEMISRGCPHLQIDILHDILPSRDDFDDMLSDLPSEPCSPSLALLDPTIPAAAEFNDAFVRLRHDSRGYSPYIRAVSALLTALLDDRKLTRGNPWMLRHLLAFVQYIDDYLQVPSIPSGLFHGKVLPENLHHTVLRARQFITYILTSSTDDAFHVKLINAASTGSAVSDDLIQALLGLIDHSRRRDSIRDSRMLGMALRQILRNASKDDTEQWVLLARKIEKIHSRTSLVIVASVTECALEPPLLDRYRNELAAGIPAIPPHKVNSEGLLAVRRLAATAPDVESDIVFLSQQRAVNVMKGFQRWLTFEEDIVEEVESTMTRIFLHLVPILQNIPGSHWDLIFDMIETNLDVSSFDDHNTLASLGLSLRLIIAIQDLVRTNKALRADWDGRRITILGLVRDRVAAKLDNTGGSIPRSQCRELALTILQDLPRSLMDHTTLPSMCHLLADSSGDVQKMTYQLLHEAAQKRTEYFVIESAVDTNDTINAELPAELIIMLQLTFDLSDGFDRNLDSDSVGGTNSSHQAISGYLLAWMVTFDLFIDASLKVRASLFNQLRSLDIIATSFLPSIFDLLDLFASGRKAFKLDPWGVDEHYLDTYDPSDALSLRLLAAHLYHRALLTVPSFVRSWVSDCTDRQLLTRVIDLTSSHFSPGIIKAELAQVRRPDSELASIKNFTVKVASSAGEVIASYTIDEHVLELTLRMPQDWPLHRMEVRDTKVVGVAEDRWRAWVLGVQQIVWQQNGRLIDGLSLFAKNVSLHFAGQVECPICYSIISVIDGSLPQKPCKTCKNRFHAGCLYKWFKTSHSSSCPLCRSDMV